MRVLITGGCGFIGAHLAERCVKEGHSVIIIDNLSGSQTDGVEAGFTLYTLDVTDAACEEVFRIHNIDCVVHLTARPAVAGRSWSDMPGLANMLALSQQYKVRKFIFASSAAVYGEPEHQPASEETPVAPVADCGIEKLLAENYCKKWRELKGLDVVILRFSKIYGPRQNLQEESNLMAALLKQLSLGGDIVIEGKSFQTGDYIFIADAVDAIHRVMTQNVPTELLNISANTSYGARELREALTETGRINSVCIAVPSGSKAAEHIRLDNSQAKRLLGWAPRYSLREGLSRTYLWYQTRVGQEQAAATRTATAAKAWRYMKPVLENLGLFGVAALITYINWKYSNLFDFQMGFDYNYIYIAVMGLLYGKDQAFLATALSSVLFTAAYVARGGDWVAMLYQAQYLTHLAAYLCVGVVTGYVTDNQERMLADVKLAYAGMSERYDFLWSTYNECAEIKDGLYEQIVNSDDSLGKVYEIIREVDSLESEQIYTAAAAVFERIMKAKALSIYTVNKNGDYLRQKICSGRSSIQRANSLKIERYDYLRTLMEAKRVFVNRAASADCPMMAAPVVHQDRVIAVIQIDALPFEQMTLHHEQLFRTAVMLITDALTRAYLYEQSIQEKKYVEGTKILNPEEFAKIRAEVEKRRQLYNQQAVLLRLASKPADYSGQYLSVAGTVRAEDYIGLSEDGHVHILLINSSSSTAQDVIGRLAGKGLAAAEADGDADE